MASCDGDPLDLVVADHRGQLRAGSLGMGQDPGPAQMRDVGDGAVSFQLQFALAVLEAVVQLVEVLLGLGDDAVQPLNGLARDLAVQELAKLDLLAVDQGVEADFDVPVDAGRPRRCGPAAAPGDPRLQGDRW